MKDLQPGHQPICHFQIRPKMERGLWSYFALNLYLLQLLMIISFLCSILTEVHLHPQQDLLAVGLQGMA